ncbi:5'-nucleotidase domain-containing protein DDB_G0275467, partial [Fagus crenata]
SFIRGYSEIASSEQTVLRPHDEVGSIAADTLAIDDDEITKIRCEFDAARKSFHKIPEAMKEMPKMNPKGIYVNKNVRLDTIQVYGFDYDYTLAHYSANLQSLIYDLAKEHMVNELRYPEVCMEFKYDPTFPIRGLSYDKSKGCLLKLDFFGSIEPERCYYGHRKLSKNEIEEIYGTRHIGQAVTSFTEPSSYIFNAFNAHALGALAEVAGPGLNFHLGIVLPALLSAMGGEEKDVQNLAKEAAETVVFVIDEEGVESLISELLKGVGDSQASIRRSSYLIGYFFRNSKLYLVDEASNIIATLIILLSDSDSSTVVEALSRVVNSVPNEVLPSHVKLVRDAVSTSRDRERRKKKINDVKPKGIRTVAEFISATYFNYNFSSVVKAHALPKRITNALVYDRVDVEFGRLQARDMLQHLWTGPISNASVDGSN